MSELREYKMTKNEYEKLLEASKPVPYICTGRSEPPSPEERARVVWKTLGLKYRFVWHTAVRAPGKSERCFLAEPLEAEEESSVGSNGTPEAGTA